jgi:hypothetical protein
MSRLASVLHVMQNQALRKPQCSGIHGRMRGAAVSDGNDTFQFCQRGPPNTSLALSLRFLRDLRVEKSSQPSEECQVLKYG